MNSDRYCKRLESDLDRWIADGWVERRYRDAILDSVATAPAGRQRLQRTLAVLGAMLVLLGGISFVVSRWQDLDNVARLAVLAAGMWLAFGLAAVPAVPRLLPILRNVLLVLGVAAYCLAIVFIGDAYFLPDRPEGFLLMGLGALAVAVLTRAEILTIAALTFFVVWTSLAVFEVGRIVHWQFWLAAVPAAGFVIYAQQTYAAHAVVVAVLCWFALTGIEMQERLGLELRDLSALWSLVLLWVWHAGGQLPRWTGETLNRARHYLLALLAFFLFGAVVAPTEVFPPAGFYLAAAIIALSLLVLVAIGRTSRPTWLWDSAAIVAICLIVLGLARLEAAISDAVMWLKLLVVAATTLWLVWQASRQVGNWAFYVAYPYFAVGVTVVFFDELWDAGSRSLFFVALGRHPDRRRRANRMAAAARSASRGRRRMNRQSGIRRYGAILGAIAVTALLAGLIAVQEFRLAGEEL